MLQRRVAPRRLQPVQPRAESQCAPRQHAGLEALDTVPSPLLQAAARRVEARWHNEYGDRFGAEQVAGLLRVLGCAVWERQQGSQAPVDARAHSVLGRRLLELLRAELIRTWGEDSTAAVQMPAMLAGIERVRESIEPDWTPYFASRLSGPDGLELLVQVAHDLRSPLTSVLFLADTLLRDQSGPVNELQRRQLRLIYGASLGLSALADDVITLAKGGDHLVEDNPVPFSVTAMFMSVRDIVRPIAEEKDLSLRFVVLSTDHRRGYPLAVTRVLLNLTTNALKFTEEGFVTVYQPFRRVAGPDRSAFCFSRAGLGLAISRELVRAMGSELSVATRPERGTRFSFTLHLPPVRES
ncbi:MAG: hypothetical protein AUH42_02825 [Gemmatimonadetes bacterium 13_1_40CM_70_11]|nr:MAG: hypothetical protein AUH42_02825 [Gemmatimonadetes bacterium 13_1_40CM_70_11]